MDLRKMFRMDKLEAMVEEQSLNALWKQALVLTIRQNAEDGVQAVLFSLPIEEAVALADDLDECLERRCNPE